ncbi:N-acetyltransferase [bacterium]|nr:N-acetyltransferase [bacterium]
MITGEKIILRPVRIEDREYTVKWRNDLFIKSSTMSHPFPVTEEMEKEWYELNSRNKSNSYLPFTVVSKERGAVLGYFSLNNINWISRNAFVSGVIGETENMGRGLGREAVELLLSYAFNYLNLAKVCAYVRTDHPAMKTWMETGAVQEGILKNHFYSGGKYSDVAFISWFRSDL